MSEIQSNKEKTYQHPAVRTPSLVRLNEIAHSLNLDLSDGELKEFQDVITKTLETTYQRLHDLPDPKLPVKYPRSQGYRPTAQENPLNAWYWRCDISGVGSGKLQGKTVAIKDSIPVAGIPMMNGSRILEGFIPDIDATVITRVLDQGGRILGKATCENLCCSGASFTSATGPVLNPVDRTRTSGGSSSGCAAVVATGEVDMAIGGDQGGSIRMPSAACGIVGLKPTFGLVPYTGISSMEATLDHTGPMARTVYDIALLLEALAGREDEGLDPRQPNDLKVPEYTKQLTGDIKGLRIGLVKEGFDPTFEPDVNQLVKQSAERLGEVGAVVEEVSIPWHLDGKHLFTAIFKEGGNRTMFDWYGAGTSARTYYDTHAQQAMARGMKSHPNDHSSNVILLRLFARYLHEDYNGIFYSKSQNLSRELRKAYDEAFEKYDVIIMPTIPKKAPKLPPPNPSLAEYIEKAFELIPNTSPFDVSGHPSLTINAGLSEGLPVGMMITGKMFDESTVLNVAYAYEKLRDGV
ncbi:uncharacterized protein LOC116298327 [Actinia tenebrosa]|uniref:Uncharacterized protein LOC116298327 n=1 Tax=Actinia tenebrosa TaxID=6105 RepID=A0A6P8ICA5_ACTTE|nr:uncharacterized protein LOC116298327 [Actinia tenebrosa]